MSIEDIQFILSHFDNHNLFPRKMMTGISNGQFTVTSIAEIFEKCQQADFTDCRINAYPEYIKWEKYDLIRQPPNFIFIDLDLSNFLKYKDPMKALDKILKNTLKNIQGADIKPSQRSRDHHFHQQHDDTESIHPTVLWTGNGYHIYLPLEAVVLDSYEQFSKDEFPKLFSIYGKYHGYSVSEVFLKFAEDYFTNGKSDPQHKPKFKSCLIRFPNTLNSKCLNKGLSYDDSKVKIIQEWNGCRLPIQFLTKNFRRWMIQQEINGHKLNNKVQKYIHKVNNYNTSEIRIGWIETLLKTPLKDNRKYCLWRIFIPYLLNVKKLSIEETILILTKWLDISNNLKNLDFDPHSTIKNNLKYVRNYKPISKNKLKEENFYLYSLIKDN
jgi:hypothetical protein